MLSDGDFLFDDDENDYDGFPHPLQFTDFFLFLPFLSNKCLLSTLSCHTSLTVPGTVMSIEYDNSHSYADFSWHKLASLDQLHPGLCIIQQLNGAQSTLQVYTLPQENMDPHVIQHLTSLWLVS